MLLRLWLSKKLDCLNTSINRLQYNFFKSNNTFEEYSITDLIDNYMKINASNKDNFIHKIIKELLYEVYNQYLLTGIPSYFDLIKEINKKYELNLLNQDENLMQKYIDYNSRKFTLLEFSQLLLQEKDVLEEIIKQYNKKQSTLFSYLCKKLKRKILR